MKKLALAAVLLSIFAIGPSLAVTPDDGVYTGEAIAEIGFCSPTYRIDVTIRDGEVRGTLAPLHVGPWTSGHTFYGRVMPGGQLAMRAYAGANIGVFGGRIGAGAASGWWYGMGATRLGQGSDRDCTGRFTLRRTGN